jgi:acetylornithine deacetylase/succinyl-diaminopimelate desuccinylase-like protein
MADPAKWERNPFELIIEGDKLYGRGTTDCLGHVALLTCFFVRLAQLKPVLDVSVHAVFIASEEAEAKVRGCALWWPTARSIAACFGGFTSWPAFIAWCVVVFSRVLAWTASWSTADWAT